jgi:hypothetical protein
MTADTLRLITNATRANGGLLWRSQATGTVPATHTAQQVLEAGPSVDATNRCNCAVAAIARQYTIDAAGQQAALTECLRDTGAFFQNARAMGVSSLECSDQQPWYKKPAVLIGGGAAVLGLILIGSWALK